MDSQELDDLKSKHNKERKELQAKITAMKKGIPVSDKKRRKQLSEEISKLENDLKEKHKNELDECDQDISNVEQATDIPVNGEVGDCMNEIAIPLEPPVRITRAQRRRNKKETENIERNKRIEEQEKINKKGPRILEINTITEALKELGLQIYNIPADGNCLYCAVKHQIEMKKQELLDVEELRKLTADFMREHKEEFMPFMYNDSKFTDEEQFEKYCKDVEKTKLWGSQLELRALSNLLKCPIKIIQSTGPPTVQGEQFTGPPLILTYHRHLYRLGEHYNSTVSVYKE